MRRVWFWAPCWYWHGRRTVMFGWMVTGRVIVAISRPGRLYPPDADLMSEGEQ